MIAQEEAEVELKEPFDDDEQNPHLPPPLCGPLISLNPVVAFSFCTYECPTQDDTSDGSYEQLDEANDAEYR